MSKSTSLEIPVRPRRRAVAAIVGVVGALVYAVGFVLVSSAPGGGEAEPEDFQKFYVTDDKTGMVIAGAFVLALGALALFWFFHRLYDAIGTPDAALGWAATALGLGLVLAGAGLLAGPSSVQAFSDAEFVGQPVAHALAQSAFSVMLVPGALFLGGGVAMLSLAGRKAGVLAGWVAIVGLVAAALQLVGFVWVPTLAIPLWVLLVGIAGVADRSGVRGAVT